MLEQAYLLDQRHGSEFAPEGSFARYGLKRMGIRSHVYRTNAVVVIELWFAYGGCMTAAAALDKQIECYRAMTGEQRLSVALELHELSCAIAREGIRRQHPAADGAEVDRLLRRRLELARTA